MCIRDRGKLDGSQSRRPLEMSFEVGGDTRELHARVSEALGSRREGRAGTARNVGKRFSALKGELKGWLLYTSDAADERSGVDLGGGRLLKKKKTLQRAYRGCV